MLATHNCHDVFRKLPPALGCFPQVSYFAGGAGEPCSAGTLFYYLLPYIEQEPLYRSAAGDSSAIGTSVIKTYYAPSDPSLPATYVGTSAGGQLVVAGSALTSYAINYYAFLGQLPTIGGPTATAETSQRVINRSFPDGMSNTIGYTERYSMCAATSSEHDWADDLDDPISGAGINGPIMYSVPCPDGTPGSGTLDGLYPQFYPTLATCNGALPTAFSAGGIQVALMDGSARIVNAGCSVAAWSNALTPAGGETQDNTW
jgi:hypothetical protein